MVDIPAGSVREAHIYWRNVVPIELPPLRGCWGDIPQLIEHFADQLTEQAGLQSKRFDPDAVKRLAAYDWPGNIRELRNAVERLLILANGPVVTGEAVERIAGLGQGEGGDARRTDGLA